MEIKGQIYEIIYQNEVNGYTIAEFEANEEQTTIVGHLSFINNRDSLMPETLERYLTGGIIKGVGPATAKRIVENFKEETISVLKFEPYRLANIKGITKTRTIEIADEFNEKWVLWQI